MRPETLNEIRKFTPPARKPSPFAPPVVAMVMAIVVGSTAAYANIVRGDLADELNKEEQINDFQQVINTSKLKDDFTETNWQYTVVAPSDQAFDKAQWRSDENSADAGAAALMPAYSDISAYDYVTATHVTPEDVAFGEHVRIPSISGNDLVFSRVADGVDGLRVNGQPVLAVREADNGVIYVIDEMLTFPEPQQQYSWAR